MILENHVVRLEPLAPEHVPGLLAAALEDRSTYGFTPVPDSEAAMTDYVDELLAGPDVPYAVCSSGAVVGTSRFIDLEPWGVEIGGTWYAASVQRTAVNTATKLLMLTHAFETWGVLRVSLQTDARNERSRNAIERIGGRFEGVRRVHKPASDGGLRDSAYFSITAPEWPDVRERLTRRLG